MTLSVLIPVRDFDASALVLEMLRLADAEGIDVEVIIGDDASAGDSGWLRRIAEEPRVRVLHSDVCLGRARNRNRMADAAAGQWLLTADGDARLLPQFSLRRYLDAATATAGIVCGGLLTPPECPSPEARLRHAYERRADLSRTAERRSRTPYAGLTLFNMLIRRDIFLDIRLDESLNDYGHEDTLFGAELCRRGIPVCHIDNPLLHTGIDTNAEFLAKTEASLCNLSRLGPRIGDLSRLHNAAEALRRHHLAAPCCLLFRATRPLLRANLLGRHPSLRLFTFYKLGYYLAEC